MRVIMCDSPGAKLEIILPPLMQHPICNGSFAMCTMMPFRPQGGNLFYYLWRASETTETRLKVQGTRRLHRIPCNGWNRGCSWSSSTLGVAVGTLRIVVPSQTTCRGPLMHLWCPSCASLRLAWYFRFSAPDSSIDPAPTMFHAKWRGRF